MLGLSRSAIVRLVALGFVKPKRGPRQAYLFSFQDVVLLRTAHELRAANIPGSKITRSLRRLKDELPTEAPLSGLRITAVGKDIVVRNRDSQWAADTGQLVMDFDVGVETKTAEPSVVRHLAAARRPVAPEPAAVSAEELFAQAETLETSDVAAAKRIYGKAIALAPDFMDAYLNLGAIMCEQGDCDGAVRLFTKAIERNPKEPLLYFNRAVALEDLNRFGEALKSYDLALQLDPNLADAHFNAGRLYVVLGNSQGAIRHYSAYRRLSR